MGELTINEFGDQSARLKKRRKNKNRSEIMSRPKTENPDHVVVLNPNDQNSQKEPPGRDGFAEPGQLNPRISKEDFRKFANWDDR
jgi:hypothetical protein